MVRTHTATARMYARTTLALALSLSLSSAALFTKAAHAQQRPTGTGGPAGAGSAPGAIAGEITLSVGEQYSLTASGIRSYSEGAPGIVDVRVPQDGSRLLVVGQRPGSTSLLVIRNDGSQQTYSITVFRLPVELVRQQVTALLQNYPGVSINQIGGRLFLEGGVASEQQQRRVQQVAAIYQGQVESLVGIDPTIVERRINVRVDLYFVELSRNASYVFGIAWPGQYGGSQGNNSAFNLTLPVFGAMTEPPSGSITALVNIPLPRLDLAAQAGWARIHRQATLVTANGQEATYFNGGDFNVLVQSSAIAAPTVQSINYGSTITLTPRFDPATSRVDLRVNADLSSLVETGGQVPSRNMSRVNTLVNLQLGQSIVLSGMRSRSLAVGSQGLPLLSQIPILGALFGSQTRRDQENEMVVIVVPTVIEGVSRQSEDRIAAALRAYEDFGGNVQDNTLVPRPSTAAPAAAAPR